MLPALRYLTVLPVGDGQGRPGGALVAFPLVGLLVGLAWAVPAAALGRIALPLAVAAAIVLAVDAFVTRVVHLDALTRLADEVTGHGGAASGDAAAPLGVAGTTTLVIGLLLRFGLLTFVAGFPGLLLAAPVAGRAAMVVAWWRGNSGSAAFGVPAGAVTAVTVMLAAAIGGLAARVPGVGAVAVAAVVGLLAGALAARRRGVVVDRDALACGIVAETAALMALAVAVIL